jgi:hypothetical protein
MELTLVVKEGEAGLKDWIASIDYHNILDYHFKK